MNCLGFVPARAVSLLGIRGACVNKATSRGVSRLLSACAVTDRVRVGDCFPRIKQQVGVSQCQGLPLRQQWRPYSSNHHIVIDRYEDLPESYTDKEGLPFRRTDLSASEVKRVLGPNAKHAASNRLLRILHGRRVAGTLDDPAYNGNTSSFTADEKSKALLYLRRNVPVDELLNAGLRAEDELRELEREASGEMEDDATVSDADKTKRASKSDPVYGESVFDEIRARNIAKREEAERQEAEEREERERLQPGPLAKLSDKPRELSPRMQKWTEEATSDMQAPPELSHFERLMPSTAFVALLVAALAGFAAIYTQPKDCDRLFPEVSASHATIGAIIGLNVLVWAAWRIPPMWKFLNRYFVLVHGVPRAPAVLLSTISHQTFFTHLLPNMLALGVFGTLLHDDVGRASFLAIYLASGTIGFLGSLWYLSLRGLLHFSTIGASGGVYGVFGAYFWLHRFDSFKILGFPPEPLEGPQGLGFIALVVALHAYAFFRKGKQTTDYMSHMAGMAAGILGVHMTHRGQGRLAAKAAPSPVAANNGETGEVDLVRAVSVTKVDSGSRPS